MAKFKSFWKESETAEAERWENHCGAFGWTGSAEGELGMDQSCFFRGLMGFYSDLMGLAGLL